MRELGLEAQPNVNVPRGLKALAGFGARRYAVIDVGTNSVKFLVGERGARRRVDAVVDRAEVTRLGEGLADAGQLQPDADRRARSMPSPAMVDEARALGALRDRRGRHGRPAARAEQRDLPRRGPRPLRASRSR